MRIVYLCHAYPPNDSGVGAFVQAAARGLAKQGHEVFVIEPYYFGHKKMPPSRNDEGVTVMQYGTDFWLYKLYASATPFARFLVALLSITKLTFFIWLYKTYQCAKYVAGFVKKHNIDIVEVPDGNEAGLLVALPFAAKCVVRIHGSTTLQEAVGVKQHGKLARYFYKQIERKLIARADALVSVSGFTGKLATQAFHLKKDIPVIYNVVNIPAEIQTQRIENYVLFAGRLSEDKGIDTLAKAWNTVIETCPGYKLIFLGKGDENIIWNHVDKRHHDSIELKGHMLRNDVLQFMANSTCFVLPSRYESFSIAIEEAMALGCASVYTERCSGPEIIDNNIDGILINPDNAADLAQAIIKILTDETFAAGLRKRAKEKSVRFTDIDAWIKENEQFYFSVLNREAYG